MRESSGLIFIIMQTIGSRIKMVRKSNELNQIEFSNKVGVSQGTLSELEQDKYKPSSETLMALKDNFNIDLHWLLYGKSNIDTSNDLMQFTNSEIDLIEKLRSLNMKDREDIITFINIKVRRNLEK